MGDGDWHVRMVTEEARAREERARRLRSEDLDRATRGGEVLGPLRLVEGPGRFDHLEGAAYYCRFRKGDRVDLREWRGAGAFDELGSIEVKDVAYPRAGIVQLQITRKRSNPPRPGRDYFLYPSGSTFLDHKMAQAVRDAAYETRPGPYGLSGLLSPTPVSERLNVDQADALRYLGGLVRDGCVQGPPGTGKTYLLRAIVAGALQAGMTVGLTAFTHAAVDNAFSRLAEPWAEAGAVRIGAKMKIRSDLYDEAWLRGHRRNAFRDLRGGERLVAATSHSWMLSSSSPTVDLLVIDEAAQVPAYMLRPLLNRARHVVCLGDHRQLPPVLQGEHGDAGATDLFSSLLDTTTPMLRTQYRMNSVVQSWSARRYYGGALVPDASVRDRDLVNERGPGVAELGAGPVQLVRHAEPGTGQANLGEARMAADLAIALTEQAHLPAHEIGVIAPHRMQNGAICRVLQERLGVERATRIQVDTVERFQGQEREAIVLSFGSNGIAAGGREGSTGFLGDPRRINVAVTRARSRFYCLASDELKRASHAGTDAGAAEIRDFTAWCENPQRSPGDDATTGRKRRWWQRLAG